MSTTAVPPARPPGALARREMEMLPGLKWSLIGHGALLFLILVKSLIFPGRPIAYIPALRVDIVGLPDVLKKDLGKVQVQKQQEINDILKKAEQVAKKVKPAPVPKETARPDEMVLHPKKQAQEEKTRESKMKRSMDRIKALAKIAADDADDKKMPTKIKGNAISPGSSLSGEAREQAQANYYDRVRDALQENWELPPWIARQNLSAQVQLFIDKKGQVHDFEFRKVSGNPQFDAQVKLTIQKSQPFPIPPKEVANSVLVDGILVGFPL